MHSAQKFLRANGFAAPYTNMIRSRCSCAEESGNNSVLYSKIKSTRLPCIQLLLRVEMLLLHKNLETSVASGPADC